MNTISEQAVGSRRRRLLHSDEFKARAVASCLQPGMSMAAVAMAHGINANFLRRWVREAEMGPGADGARSPLTPGPAAKATPAPATFVPMQLPAPNPAPAIRIELRRGTTTITVTWPSEAAGACAARMRELLR